MPVAAVADEVDYHVAAECRAVFGRNFSDAHDGIGIFAVYVENGDGLALGDVGSEARGMFLARRRGEADEIVHDDVDRATHGVGRQVREIQRFRPDALPGESGVAMHHDGNDFVERSARSVDVGATQPVTRLLGARPAGRNRIDSFQMARIRHQVDPDFFSGTANVCARRADMVFDVARAQHAARIHVLEPSHDLVRAFARRMHHDVQAATMTHGHYGRVRAMLRGRIQDGIEQGNQRRDALEREAL